MPSLGRAAMKAVYQLRILYVGDATLARQCLGRSIEVVGVVGATFDPLQMDDRSGVRPPFDVLFIEHGYPGVETLAILESLAARKLRVPVVIVAEWDETLAVLALRLGAADYIVKSKASFRAVYFRLNRLIAHSALLKEQCGLRDAQASTIDQARATREDLERRLAEAQTALLNVGQLEQQLADRNAALQHVRQHATTERQIASQDFARRQSELESALAEEVSQRSALQTKLAQAEAFHQVAERRRLAEAAASAHTLVRQHEESTARIQHATRDRDALERRLADAATALAGETADREVVEQQLADANRALQHAEFRHASEMEDAVARLTAGQEKAE